MKPLTWLLALALLIASCGTAPPWVQAAKALDATVTSVNISMQIAGDLYRSGKINDDQKAQILKAYATYQVAARTAYGAVKAWNDAKGGAPPESVMADVNIAASNLLKLIEEMKR